MDKNQKNFVIVCGIFVIVGVISIMSYLPTRMDITSKILVSKLPMEIGKWTAVDIPISEKSYEILETRNLIMREYKRPDAESVILYIIYSEDNRKVSHPPEVCYMGSGLEILSKSVIDLPVSDTLRIKANHLLTEIKNRKDMVVYWFKAGKLHTDNYFKQQLSVVLGRTIGKRTAGALIRISTMIDEDGEKAARERLQEFTSGLFPLLAVYVP